MAPTMEALTSTTSSVASKVVRIDCIYGEFGILTFSYISPDPTSIRLMFTSCASMTVRVIASANSDKEEPAAPSPLLPPQRSSIHLGIFDFCFVLKTVKGIARASSGNASPSSVLDA